MKNSMLKCALVAAVFLALLPTGFAQGSLTPPGPPAPTMKSLDQIEPRTIVNAVNTPGDAGEMFIISQPGSYYLTTNITASTAINGITIKANNVTLDLSGFAVQGPGTFSSGTAYGIYIPNAQTNLTVRNGSVSGWNGIGGGAGAGVIAKSVYTVNLLFEHLNISDTGDGIFLFCPCVIRDCTVAHNSSSGIVCSFGLYDSDASTVTGCTVNENGEVGISITTGTVSACAANNNGGGGMVSYDGSVSDCTVYGNDGFGIYAQEATVSGCGVSYNNLDGIVESSGTVSDCSVYGNGGEGIDMSGGTVSGCTSFDNIESGIYGAQTTVVDCTANNNDNGIFVLNDCVVTGCVASGNGTNGITTGTVCKVSDCIASGNTGLGIVTGDNAQITGCHVNGNTLGGIKFSNFSLVRENMVDYQKATTTTPGITMTGNNNRVEGNNITRCGIGLQATSTANLILRNSVSGSTGVAYSIVAGNSVGVIVVPTSSGTISGSSGGGIGSTDPTANFAF